MMQLSLYERFGSHVLSGRNICPHVQLSVLLLKYLLQFRRNTLEVPLAVGGIL